jgi:N-carbamoyl-L-amino-acid hydrolase
MRKNAGLAMARILENVDEIALSHAPHAVGAAGHIDVYPKFEKCYSWKSGFYS